MNKKMQGIRCKMQITQTIFRLKISQRKEEKLNE